MASKYQSVVLLACLFWINDIQGVLGLNSNEDFENLAERFIEWRLYETPEFATFLGIHKYDHRLQEYSEEGFRRHKDDATEFLIEAYNIDESELTDTNDISLQVLRKELEAYISGYKYRKHSIYNNMSPFDTPLLAWEFVAIRMKYETVDDYLIYIERLRQNAIQIKNVTELLGETIIAGTTMNKWALNGVVEALEAELAKPVNDTLWYATPFTSSNDFDTFNETMKDNITATLIDVVTNLVIPGYNTHLTYMENTYMPNTRPDIGASSLPDGNDYYLECLKWHLSVDMTPAEVHQTGLDEVARIDGLMQNIMRDEGFEGDSVSDFIDYLFEDPNNFYQGETASEDMLQGYKDIIEEAHNNLNKILTTVPDYPLEVVPATNPQSPDGYYYAPPIDGSKPGTFTANVFNPETKPKFNMIALSLHEAEPGHHTEAVYNRDQNVPLFRLVLEDRNYNAVPFHWLFHTAYVEGWALYAESLGVEMGMYSNNLDRFGQLNYEMFRAVRLVVDTGIHAFNWTREEAMNYMRENTAHANSSIENEINRYIALPGQACAYKIGQLKIGELRSKAEDELEDLFDIREFNSEVLSFGPAPLSLLENRIDDWIEEVKDANKNISGGHKSTANYCALVVMIFLHCVMK